jgi:hypothetical protein
LADFISVPAGRQADAMDQGAGLKRTPKRWSHIG